MQVHRVVSNRHSSRADWWQEQAQRVLEEGSFEPYIAELFITDQSAELDLVRSLPDPMTSVALAVPAVASKVPLVVDVVECDQLLTGREGAQGEATVQAIFREEGFHARDFSQLIELPEAQWRPH